jgi:hypothetical protein
MKLNKVFLCTFLIFLLSLPTVFAQAGETAPAVAQAIQELKTVDIYFGYTSSLTANTNDTKYFWFSPVDWGNKSFIRVALIRIVEEQNGSPTHYLWVNGQPCLTASITALVGRSQYVADFECTNLINTIGNYSVTYQASGVVSNIHYRGWVTYTTDLTNQTIASQKLFIEALNYFDATAEEKLKSNRDYCFSNTTMRKVLTIEKCGILYNVTTCFTINKTEDTYCNYGCDAELNECSKAPYINALLTAGGIVGFLILLLLILRLTGKI